VFYAFLPAAGTSDHSPGVGIIPLKAEWRSGEAGLTFSLACLLSGHEQFMALQKGDSFRSFLKEKDRQLFSSVRC